jgi:hypothetical protein
VASRSAAGLRSLSRSSNGDEVCRRLLRDDDLGDPHHPKIDQRRKELGSAHELIYLIAPAEVVKQADRVRAALHDLWSDSHDKMGALAVGAPGEVRTGGTTDQVPLVESILEASIAFRNAARRDLGAEDGLSASRAGKVGMAVS